ncbi:uncharacterized protein, partial [Argopecten irradians]|uniref:uncharacterized protein n=1 Tax=Argopecten irradians TaxID=31199 RepID=UPI003718F11B
LVSTYIWSLTSCLYLHMVVNILSLPMSYVVSTYIWSLTSCLYLHMHLYLHMVVNILSLPTYGLTSCPTYIWSKHLVPTY